VTEGKQTRSEGSATGRHKADAIQHADTVQRGGKATGPPQAQAAVLHTDAAEVDPGILRPISPGQMLDHARIRYDAARSHWTAGETEPARQELDRAMRILALVPAELDEDMAAQQDELQLLLARLVVTMGASRAGQLEVGSEMPLPMNQYVEREIRSFQTSERQFFVRSYRRSGQYMAHILQRLQEQHMPSELAWLPLIESGFNPRALSPARALGLWQFIPSTGYRFGLERDAWVDERMDPEMAADAALAYLKHLHELFGDWSTAVAAYNCGEANVAGAIRRQPHAYLDSFWDLFPVLPYETARYVPRLYATLHIVRDPAKYGFEDLGEPDAPLPVETVEISRQLEVREIARLLEADDELLRQLNPSLRRGITPPRPFRLRVPQGLGPTLVAKLAELPPGKPVPANERESVLVAGKDGKIGHPTPYRVRRGDTLWSIASRFRVSVASIMQANSLSSKHRLQIGQVLRIPRRGA
jgi:membrane-bound lytic murein transglycosylase D